MQIKYIISNGEGGALDCDWKGFTYEPDEWAYFDYDDELLEEFENWKDCATIEEA